MSNLFFSFLYLCVLTSPCLANSVTEISHLKNGVGSYSNVGEISKQIPEQNNKTTLENIYLHAKKNIVISPISDGIRKRRSRANFIENSQFKVGDYKTDDMFDNLSLKSDMFQRFYEHMDSTQMVLIFVTTFFCSCILLFGLTQCVQMALKKKMRNCDIPPTIQLADKASMTDCVCPTLEEVICPVDVVQHEQSINRVAQQESDSPPVVIHRLSEELPINGNAETPEEPSSIEKDCKVENFPPNVVDSKTVSDQEQGHSIWSNREISTTVQDYAHSNVELHQNEEMECLTASCSAMLNAKGEAELGIFRSNPSCSNDNLWMPTSDDEEEYNSKTNKEIFMSVPASSYSEAYNPQQDEVQNHLTENLKIMPTSKINSKISKSNLSCSSDNLLKTNDNGEEGNNSNTNKQAAISVQETSESQAYNLQQDDAQDPLLENIQTIPASKTKSKISRLIG